MNKKIKVVWITQFSNTEVRSNLNFRMFDLFSWVRYFGKGAKYSDFAKWITNGIKEFEKVPEIELHVVSHHMGLSSTNEFVMNGIYYHFFKTEDDNFIAQVSQRLSKHYHPSYNKNSQIIEKIVDKISPDIIHLYGAENPIYGMWVLYTKTQLPIIVSLQTLLSDPKFFGNYPMGKEEYEFRSTMEREIIQRADYVASAQSFKKIIAKEIKENVKYLDVRLAVAEKIEKIECQKEFDFVYFALDIEKAADWAIEAFALAQKKHPTITLNIIGGYNYTFKDELDTRIKELDIKSNIVFSGRQPTHSAVIQSIQRSKFALLPLKVDLLTGTIREAMYCEIPVVSTITPSTPELNNERQSILLSPKGDFESMANNMCLLIEQQNFADNIRKNALLTIKERYNNELSIWQLSKEYSKIVTITNKHK